jgi:spore germination protein YaaH
MPLLAVRLFLVPALVCVVGGQAADTKQLDLGGVEQHGAQVVIPAPPRCPCTDPSWCTPVQAPRPSREVLVPLDMNSPAYGHGGIAGTYMGDWRSQIDWDTVTILVLATSSQFGLRTAAGTNVSDWDVYCHAHSKGVRVLPTVAGGGNPATVMNVSDPTSRGDWVAKTTATLVTLGLDGIMFDLEWTGSAGITAMLAETAASFRAAQPHALVGVWTDTNSTDVMQRGYDIPAIGKSVDFIALMAYGMSQCACGDTMCEVSSCNPDAGCRCQQPGANSNLSYLQRFVDVFRTRVDASKLIVVWPAYGLQFSCAPGTRGDGCLSPSWYSAISYHAAQSLLATVTANGSLVTSPRFDAASASQMFRWHLSIHRPEVQIAGAERQVWFDDAHAIGVKCAYARDAGLRGVGFYQGTGAYPDGTNGSMAAMYSAVRRNFLDGVGPSA